jgi:hypothetical protein
LPYKREAKKSLIHCHAVVIFSSCIPIALTALAIYKVSILNMSSNFERSLRYLMYSSSSDDDGGDGIHKERTRSKRLSLTRPQSQAGAPTAKRVKKLSVREKPAAADKTPVGKGLICPITHELPWDPGKKM